MSLPHNATDIDDEKDWKSFPLLASYVTIKLDPVKSVEILDDDEATVAAHDAVSKVYVGYTYFVCIYFHLHSARDSELNTSSLGVGLIPRIRCTFTT